MTKRKKCILIERLIDEGWFSNEKEAISWAMERKILVNDKPITSVKEIIYLDSTIRVKEYYKTKYVNKGGLKLEGALKDFKLSVVGKVALDCGASTGGFTDCLLDKGASLVYAVDVGFGQLAGKLSTSPYVINMEKTNLSDEKLLYLDPRPHFITLDLSYLSLKKAVPICCEILGGEGIIVALIKPLFEVDSSQIRKSGQINDRNTLEEVLMDICDHFCKMNMDILGLTYSPIRGNHDTLEYFICLGCGYNFDKKFNISYKKYIQEILDKSFQIEKFQKNAIEFVR